MNIQNALERLCARGAPSGFEGPAAAVALELLRPLMDEVWTDKLGSVVGLRRCGKPNAKKLLLDAHLDEIGLIVTGVEDGFLRFQDLGGVDPRMLPNRELTILTDPPLFGLVACLPPHVQKPGDLDKAAAMEDLYIDIGLSQEEAVKAVPVGTPIVYRGGCFPLGEEQLCGKAMDDRACFVTLLRAAELLADKELDVDLYLLGSVQEEVGGAGAKTGAFAIAPDWCVAVDVTHGRTPDAPNPRDRTCALNQGPAIGIGPNMTRWMTERMIAKAKEHAIPWQAEVMEGGTGTNGWHMQTVREGIATSVISLPLKYMHTPMEVLALEDMELLARLLAAFTEHLGREAETIC